MKTIHCLTFAVYLLSAVFFPPLPSTALALSSNELIDNAALYDGKPVVFEGEVIGDVMARGEYVWLNVNDGLRAIGVWAEKSMADEIKISGDYNQIGDKIAVAGIFHKACPEHGGDLDIHAEKISIVEEGHTVEHPVNLGKIIITFVFLLGTALVLFYARFMPPGRP